MPALNRIADIVNRTLPTFEKNKVDSVGIAQRYPDYEIVKQMITGKRKTTDASYLLDTTLEIGAPSSFEASYPNHPAETATHQLMRNIQTPFVKVRTSITFSEDEKELQGPSTTKIVDVVQRRMIKWDRDYWEGVEHSLLAMPDSATQHPDVLRGMPYWICPEASIAADALNMNGGDDPTGHTAGAGGITKAQEPRWANATAKFAKVSQGDFFDKLDQFYNRRRLQALVPGQEVAPEVPAVVIYTIEPIKRAVNRYFTGSNENIGKDAGVYRGANFWNSDPITIWHAMSDPDSPVQATTGTVLLVDWNAFMYQVHSGYDRKRIGPTMLPNVPDQMVGYEVTWHALHCTRRDRCMRMVTDTENLQPSAS